MSKLKDCITKINAKRSDFKFDQEQLIQMEQDMLDSGVDPLEAARQAAITYHKQLFDEMAEVRKQLGLKPNEYKIGTVGNVEEIEGKYAEMISQATDLQTEEESQAEVLQSEPVLEQANPQIANQESEPSQQQVGTELAPSRDQVGTKSGLSQVADVATSNYESIGDLAEYVDRLYEKSSEKGKYGKEYSEWVMGGMLGDKPSSNIPNESKKAIESSVNITLEQNGISTKKDKEAKGLQESFNKLVNSTASDTAEPLNDEPSLESIAAELYNQLNTEEELSKDKARQGVLLLGKQLQSSWAKMLPGLKVVTDNYAYHLTQAKLNGEVEGYMEDYPGFYNPANNTVYLNPQKVGLDTPVHEFGHVWYQVANQTEKGRKIIERGKQLIKNSPYLKTVQEQEEYQFPDETPERREELQLEEALITAIGNRGADFVEQSMRNQFVDWLLELLDAINIKIKQFKGKKIDLSSLTLDEYLDLAAADILSGGEVFTIEPTAGAYSAVTSKPVVKNQVIAYHGSPYSFDKFTTGKIGTGEGAQAFGWGLYFTDLKSIAQEYASKLGSNKGISKSVFIGDKPLSEIPDRIWTPIEDAVANLWGNPFTKEDVIKELTDFLNNPNEKDKEGVQIAINTINEKGLTVDTNRNLYKVSLHQGKTPDQYDWLVWDKFVDKSTISKLVDLNDTANDYISESNRLSKEYGSVREAIFKKADVSKLKSLMEKVKSEYSESDFALINSSAINGSGLYQALSKKLGGDKQASLFLLRAGIDGIKYPAESIARGTTSDNARGFNYVVFDENAVKIEEQIRFSIASTRRIESVIPDVQSKVRKAEEMESKGSNPESIYKQTGLSRGVEGAWEAELDYDVKFNKGIYLPIIKQQVEKSGNKIYKLSDVINYPQLFKAYPELRTKRVVFISDPEKIWIGAANSKGDIGINLADDVQIEQEEVAYRMGYKEADAVDKAYISTIIHEVQHLIQRIEGWPGGFNLQEAFEIAKNKIAGFFQKEAEATGDQDFVDAATQVSEFLYEEEQDDDLYKAVRIAAERRYASSSGEQQARNVQRRFFDPAKRELRPEQTETVPRNEQQQDRIQARLSVGTYNWSDDIRNSASRLYESDAVQVTENPDKTYTLTTAGKSIQFATRQEAEFAKQRIISSVLSKQHADIPAHVVSLFAQQSKNKSKVPRIAPSGIQGKIKDISDIIFDAASSLKQRVIYAKGQGRRNTLGSYNPRSAAVKIRFAGDMDTTAHEIGHALDDRYGFLTEIQGNVNAIAELYQFAQYGSKPPKGYPKKNEYIQGEGVAEFIRAYVVNPDLTKQNAPNLYSEFERVIPEDTRKSLDGFSNDVRAWVGATAQQKILSNVQIVPENKNSLLKSLKGEGVKPSWYDRFKRAWTDPLAMFDKAIEYAKGVKGIDELLPSNDPMVLARLLNGFDSKFQEMMKSGFVDAKNNVLTDANGRPMTLDWLFAPLGEYDTDGRLISASRDEVMQRINQTIAFMISERTIELNKRLGKRVVTGIGGGIYTDIDVANQFLVEFNGYPLDLKEKIREAASRYRQMSDAVLMYMVDKGRLEYAVYDAEEKLIGGYLYIKQNNIYYVAMQRLQEIGPNEAIDVKGSAGTSLGSVVDVIKTAKGSAKKIVNPYESLMDNMYKAVKDADRNEVLQEFRKLVLTTREFQDGEPMPMGEIAEMVSATDKHNVKIFVNGKPEYWRVQEDVYNAIKNLDSEGIKLPKFLTLLPRIMRATVTNFPVFAARNSVRDFLSRIILSNEANPLKAVKDIVTNKKQWSEAARFGALNAGFYMQDKETYYYLMNEAVRRVSKSGGVVITKDTLSRMYRKYHDTLYKSEQVNRVAEYKSAYDNAKKKGMDDYDASIYAASKSRELIDFAVMGNYMKYINQLVPFSNAAIQGLRSAVIKAKQNPAGFAFRTLLFSVIPQLLLWKLNHDDDETAYMYENLPDYQRDMFYNFRMGNNWLSIPKPFELGITASGVDRIMSYGNGNKSALDGYVGSVTKSMFPFDEADAGGPWKIFIEMSFNKDFFRGKNIIPQYEEGLNLAMRDTEGASRMSKFIGSYIKTDPRMIDYFIRSQFAYFGKLATNLSNIGAEDARTKFNISDTGFAKEYPAYGTKPVQEWLKFSEEFALSRTKDNKDFKDAMKAYFNEKDPDAKVALGVEMIRVAERLLSEFNNEQFKKERIEEKRKNDDF